MFIRHFSSGEKTADSHLREREWETFVQLHPEFQTSSRSVRGVWRRARTTVQDGYRHAHFHRRPHESSDGGENSNPVISQPLVIQVLKLATNPGKPITVINWESVCWWGPLAQIEAVLFICCHDFLKKHHKANLKVWYLLFLKKSLCILSLSQCKQFDTWMNGWTLNQFWYGQLLKR